MSKYNQIKVLFTEADRETLEPVLEQLRARSLRIIEGSDSIQKGDVVLAALSENFYADSTQSDRLLSLIGSGAESILPLCSAEKEKSPAIIPGSCRSGACVGRRNDVLAQQQTHTR